MEKGRGCDAFGWGKVRTSRKVCLFLSYMDVNQAVGSNFHPNCASLGLDDREFQ